MTVLATPDLSPTDWAYLAGLIDGEGCVSIDIVRKLSGGRLLPVYRPSLAIVSTTPCLIDWVYVRLPFGARSIGARRPPARPQHRVSYVYRAAAMILRAVRPYLILKGTQADVVLGMPLSTNRWDHTADVHRAQLAAVAEIRRLNARGLAAIT